MVLFESLFDVANRVCKNERHSVRLRFAWSKRQFRWQIPRLCFLPFVLGKRGAMHHPVVETFKGDAARGEVAEDGGACRAARAKNRVVCLERSLSIRQNQ